MEKEIYKTKVEIQKCNMAFIPQEIPTISRCFISRGRRHVTAVFVNKPEKLLVLITKSNEDLSDIEYTIAFKISKLIVKEAKRQLSKKEREKADLNFTSDCKELATLICNNKLIGG